MDGSRHAGDCPSTAAGKPSLEAYPLGIGGKADPAGLVFGAPPGPALNVRRDQSPAFRGDLIADDKELGLTVFVHVLFFRLGWQDRRFGPKGKARQKDCRLFFGDLVDVELPRWLRCLRVPLWRRNRLLRGFGVIWRAGPGAASARPGKSAFAGV
jgi:hypothetical protein